LLAKIYVTTVLSSYYIHVILQLNKHMFYCTDDKPSFSAVAAQTIADTDSIGTAIVTLAATDADSGDSSALTYSMTSSSTYFEVVGGKRCIREFWIFQEILHLKAMSIITSNYCLFGIRVTSL